MNNLQVFQSNEFGEVRVVMQNGEPWFVAKDVCEILEIGNPSQAVARLDDDERGLILNDTPSGLQEMAHVNESGLYALVLGSRKPEAKAFQRWVRKEVLPSIRKHGAYLPAELSPQLQVLIGMELEQKRLGAEQKRLQERQEQTEQRLTLVKDTLLHRDDDWRNWVNRLMSRVTEASGGDYQLTRSKSYKLLEDRGKCDLSTRARNLRARIEEQGATKTRLDGVNKMDVIESDARLKEIYTAVVKEMAIVCSAGV